MTNVLWTCRIKIKSQLRKFFWHQSAKCKSRLLAKCPIGESSNWLTARFRFSGHNEKQLTGKTTKQIGEIRVTLRNDNDGNWVCSDNISKLKGVCTIYTKKLKARMVFSFLEKSQYKMCERWNFQFISYLLGKSLCIEVKNKSKLQAEKLYSKIASQLCYLLLLEVYTHRYRGLHDAGAADDEEPDA